MPAGRRHPLRLLARTPCSNVATFADRKHAVPTLTTISSRSFNQDVGAAKRAADRGPVVITDRGQPAYVLMRHDDWLRQQSGRRSVRQALDLPGVEDIDFEPPRLGGVTRAADLG
jgi:hypothetical protein